jgi:PAS domain-containing protein
MDVTRPDDNGVLHRPSPPEAQLQATLELVPAYAWYARPNGALTFVNARTADYLGLPADHALRFGTDTGADWDSHIPLLHMDDHEETRRVWWDCLRTGSAGEVSFRVRNADGGYGGALAIVLWIGAYALVFGAFLLASAFRLRGHRHLIAQPT